MVAKQTTSDFCLEMPFLRYRNQRRETGGGGKGKRKEIYSDSRPTGQSWLWHEAQTLSEIKKEKSIRTN